MKIGLIVPGFSANEGDWCIPALLNIVRILAEQHEVHVFALRYPNDTSTYTVYNATVHAMGGATQSGLYRLPLIIRTIASVTQNASFDVLHGLWADEPGIVAVVAGRMLGIPVLVSVMGGEFVNLSAINYGHQLSRAAQWMIDQSTRNADCVTVGSSLLFQLVATQTNSQQLERVSLGVDTELFYPSESTFLDGKFKILHVAALTPIKNHLLMLQAFAEVQKSVADAHLHLVGGGVLQSQLEAYANEWGLNVTFHGEILHDQLPDYYRAADLCVLTSHFESQSMVVLEAGACECLTVGTAVGILPELLPNELMIFNTESPKAPFELATIISHLAQHPEKLSELSRRVYQIVQDRYSLRHAMQSWQKLYVHLVQ